MKKLEVGETVAGLKLKFACLVVGVDTSKLPLGVSVVTLPVSFSNGLGYNQPDSKKWLVCCLGASLLRFRWGW